MNPPVALAIILDLYQQLTQARAEADAAQQRVARLEAENADLRSKVVEDDDIPPGPVDAP